MKETILFVAASVLLYKLLTAPGVIVNNTIPVPAHDTVEVMNAKLQGHTIYTDSVSFAKGIYHKVIGR